MSNRNAVSVLHGVAAPAVGQQQIASVNHTLFNVALIFLAHAPLLAIYFSDLWRTRPHYEFFPFVLVAVVWLIWRRWPDPPSQHSGRTRGIGLVLLVAGLGCLTTAVLLFSPWLGAVAAVLSSGGLLLRAIGRTAVRDLFGPWLLLFLLIVPPVQLDDVLIGELQRITSVGSSALLDLMGTRHQLAGNVFRLPDRELFVAEACSGIHSQFVLVVFSLLLAVIARRSWFHAVLLAMAAVFFSVAVNTVRVSGIVFAAARFQQDLSTGWQHEVIGYSLILGGFGLLLVFDRFLSTLLAPVEGEGNLLTDLWNRCIASYPVKHLSGYEDEIVSRDKGEVVSGDESAAGSRLSSSLAMAGGLLASLATMQCVMAPAEGAPRDIGPDQYALPLDDEWLANPVAEWPSPAYKFETREMGSELGERSHVWQYPWAQGAVSFAVDFPFLNWHHLEKCYCKRGWREVSRRTARAGTDPDAADGDFNEMEFNNPGGERLLLLYSILDRAGSPIPAPNAAQSCASWLSGKLRNSPLASRLIGLEQADPRYESTVQVQLVAASELPLHDDERQEARELFVKFRQQLRRRLVKAAEGLNP